MYYGETSGVTRVGVDGVAAIFPEKKPTTFFRHRRLQSDDFFADRPRLSTVHSKFRHIFKNFIRVSPPGGCHPGRSPRLVTPLGETRDSVQQQTSLLLIVSLQKSSSAVTELVSGQSPVSVSTSTGASSTATPTDGAVFVVHRQPFALDRFTVTDVRPRDATGARLVVTQ